MDQVTVRGVDVPALGLGTSPMTGETCRRAVASALELGYRHVDTAQMYDNESAVGEAIAAADVPREDVFLVTKVLRENLAAEDVHRSVAGSLDRLGTHVDLLLIHSPSRTVPIAETIGAMNELQAAGDVQHIGVSNFSVAQLREAAAASETPVLTNQVSYHPYEDRTELLEYCIEHDVALTAYSPLAKGRAADDETLAEIGAAHGKTAAQVALRWLIQQDSVVAIPKAASRDHQAENLAVFDFRLSDAEMRRISELGGGPVERLLALLGLS